MNYAVLLMSSIATTLFEERKVMIVSL